MPTPTHHPFGDTLKIVQIAFYAIASIVAILTYRAARRGLLNTVNTEYQKRVMDRLQKLSEDLYSEFDPSSPAHWATTNPVDRLALVDRRRGGSNQPIQHLIRDVRNVGDRGLSIVGVTRVMAGVKLGQNVNTVR